MSILWVVRLMQDLTFMHDMYIIYTAIQSVSVSQNCAVNLLLLKLP